MILPRGGSMDLSLELKNITIYQEDTHIELDFFIKQLQDIRDTLFNEGFKDHTIYLENGDSEAWVEITITGSKDIA
jgi:hypothetical protein